MNRDSIGQPERVTQNRIIALFRDELDKQIEGVFTGAGEAIQRTRSGRCARWRTSLAAGMWTTSTPLSSRAAHERSRLSRRSGT